MAKQLGKETYNFRLDPRLMAQVKDLIQKMPYPPTLTQVVESGLRKECRELETILSNRRVKNG